MIKKSDTPRSPIYTRLKVSPSTDFSGICGLVYRNSAL